MSAILLGIFALNTSSSFACTASKLNYVQIEEVYDNYGNRSPVTATGSIIPGITFIGGTLYIKTHFDGTPASWDTVLYRNETVTGCPCRHTNISKKSFGKGWITKVSIPFTEFNDYAPTICVTAMPVGSAEPVFSTIKSVPIQK